MKYLAAFLGLLLAGCAYAAEPLRVAGEDGPCVADRGALMALDYWAFDQGTDGIRAVVEKPGCELVVADLYRDYHAALRASDDYPAEWRRMADERDR